MLHNYQLVKSKRKSFGISIKLDGTVIVRVPLETSDIAIDNFIAKHQPWINTKIGKNNAQRIIQATENSFYYLGQSYPVKESFNVSDLIQFDSNHFVVLPGYIDQAATFIQQWYTKQAWEVIIPIIQKYSISSGLKYANLKITTAKNRWGSCNSNGTICFSYRIVMLPLEIIHYIVAHELSHLRHLNHSKHFWQQVKLIYPNYKIANIWLKENKYTLAAHIYA